MAFLSWTKSIQLFAGKLLDMQCGFQKMNCSAYWDAA